MEKKYVSPLIEVNNIHLEEGIAAGSAFVRPQNGNDEVIEQWYEDDQESKSIDWF
ncbi:MULTISPECIES: hypothetical protein [Sphingobacterium]|jgi:hypothetical protein|uniref:hypothetical protein n=1 Tax=Sphingobacterium TaxID=28453 RepID=UPI0010C44D05|nr:MULTISPECIES: hypothetical protein [Sphingobacterium]MCT1531310.1 hypothetical protein [Sphingobacterium daejeonense]VTP97936.1 Uncharacterised protein [Sphingobacterium daejeonense]